MTTGNNTVNNKLKSDAIVTPKTTDKKTPYAHIPEKHLCQMVIDITPMVTDIESTITFGYKKGRYIPDLTAKDVRTKAEIHHALLKYETTKNILVDPPMINGTYSYLKTMTCQPIESWRNRYNNYINVKNGLLDIETWELISHSSAVFTTHMLNVEYKPEVGYDDYEIYIKTMFNDNDINNIQELEGNIIAPHYVAKKILLVYGEGNTGKTTHFLIFQSMIGKSNCSNLGLTQMHMANNLIGIYDKVGNISYEIPSGINGSDGSLLKSLSGNDPITLRPLYKAPFYPISRAKLYFCGNIIPKFKQDCLDDAFLDRWCPIHCDNTFALNSGFIDKMTTPDMLSQQFNWLVEGYKRLKSNNWAISNPMSTDDIRELFEQSIVTEFDKWFSNCCRSDPTGWVSTDALFRSYLRWCIIKHVSNKPTKTSFGISINNQQLFSGVKKERRKITGAFGVKDRVNGYTGLILDA